MGENKTWIIRYTEVNATTDCKNLTDRHEECKLARKARSDSTVPLEQVTQIEEEENGPRIYQGPARTRSFMSGVVLIPVSGLLMESVSPLPDPHHEVAVPNFHEREAFLIPKPQVCPQRLSDFHDLESTNVSSRYRGLLSGLQVNE